MRRRWIDTASWVIALWLGFLVESCHSGVSYTFASPTALFNFATQTVHGPKVGDMLILQNGVYYDTAPEATMEMSNGKMMSRPAFNSISWGWTIRNSGFTIKAETPGGVVWSPPAPGIFIQYEHGADNNVFTGIQFKSGYAQENYNIFDVWGNNNTFSHLYFADMAAATYIRFAPSSYSNLVTHSNFEYKPQSVTGPILSLEASDILPGAHRVRYSNFYHMPNRVGTLDPESQNIRIGDESMRSLTSRCVVEYNVFNSTYGMSNDAILVSSRENVIRYNTLANNQRAMVTVSMADYNVVYSNFFINAGGVRVAQCNNTYVYNNYFQSSGDGVDSWPFALSGFDADQYAVSFFFNTVVESAYVNLGATTKLGSKVVFANNIFRKAVNPTAAVAEGNLFWGNTEGVTMLNNMYYGTLNSGVTTCGAACGCDDGDELCDIFPLGNKFKRDQMTNADPHLTWDGSLGYYVPSSPDSPAIAMAVTASAMFDVPSVNDDPHVLYDITGRPRPTVGKKDIGCYQTGTTNRLSEMGVAYGPQSLATNGASYVDYTQSYASALPIKVIRGGQKHPLHGPGQTPHGEEVYSEEFGPAVALPASEPLTTSRAKNWLPVATDSVTTDSVTTDSVAGSGSVPESAVVTVGVRGGEEGPTAAPTRGHGTRAPSRAKPTPSRPSVTDAPTTPPTPAAPTAPPSEPRPPTQKPTKTYKPTTPLAPATAPAAAPAAAPAVAPVVLPPTPPTPPSLRPIEATSKPVEGVHTDKPTESVDPSKPVEKTLSWASWPTIKPAEGKGKKTTKPAEKKSSKPVEGSRAGKPTMKPAEGRPTTKPHDHPRSDKPIEHKSSDKPTETTTKLSERQPTRTLKPVEGRPTVKPHQHPRSTKPLENSASNKPVERRDTYKPAETTNKPVEIYSNKPVEIYSNKPVEFDGSEKPVEGGLNGVEASSVGVVGGHGLNPFEWFPDSSSSSGSGGSSGNGVGSGGVSGSVVIPDPAPPAAPAAPTLPTPPAASVPVAVAAAAAAVQADSLVSSPSAQPDTAPEAWSFVKDILAEAEAQTQTQTQAQAQAQAQPQSQSQSQPQPQPEVQPQSEVQSQEQEQEQIVPDTVTTNADPPGFVPIRKNEPLAVDEHVSHRDGEARKKSNLLGGGGG